MSDIRFSANKIIPSYEQLHCFKFENKAKTNMCCSKNYMQIIVGKNGKKNVFKEKYHKKNVVVEMKISYYGLCDMLLFYLLIKHFDKRQFETKVNEYAARCLSNLQLQMI